MKSTRVIVRATAVVAASIFMLPSGALAQAARAGVVTTLHGTATVVRASAPEPAPLRFRDDVFVRDRIVTGERSTVRILLGGKAVVTVRERSTVTISETPATSTVQVDAGKIAVAVARERMRPGESVEIRTPNAVAGVRGTIVIAEVSPAPAAGGGVTSSFTLLTGIVDVSRLDAATGRVSQHRVTLNPLQTISVGGRLGTVRAITRTEARSLASEYKVTLPTPPPPANAQVLERQLEEAVQHSAVLVGSPQHGASATGIASTKDSERSVGGKLRVGAGSASLGSTGLGSASLGSSGLGGGSLGGTVGGTVGSLGSSVGGVVSGTGGLVTDGVGAVGGLLGGDDLRNRTRSKNLLK
jgi:hypothetical protein